MAKRKATSEESDDTAVTSPTPPTLPDPARIVNMSSQARLVGEYFLNPGEERTVIRRHYDIAVELYGQGAFKELV